MVYKKVIGATNWKPETLNWKSNTGGKAIEFKSWKVDAQAGAAAVLT